MLLFVIFLKQEVQCPLEQQQSNSLESRAVRVRPRVHLTATVLPLGARAQEGQVPRWEVTLKRLDAEPLLYGS